MPYVTDCTKICAECNEFLGQTISVKVTAIKDGGRNIVVSRKAALEDGLQEQKQAVLASLEQGKLVTGTVIAIRDFGAFVDLGGFEALIPASEVSYERKPVSDALKAGDKVLEASVLEIKQDEKAIRKLRFP